MSQALPISELGPVKYTHAVRVFFFVVLSSHQC